MGPTSWLISFLKKEKRMKKGGKEKKEKAKGWNSVEQGGTGWNGGVREEGEKREKRGEKKGRKRGDEGEVKG